MTTQQNDTAALTDEQLEGVAGGGVSRVVTYQSVLSPSRPQRFSYQVFLGGRV